MKWVGLVILSLVALVAALPGYQYEHSAVSSPADTNTKQLLVLKLLNHVLQPVTYKDIEDMGRRLDLQGNVDMYTKVEVLKNFIKLYETGALPRGEIFTLHIDRQLKEVVSMFHLLYYAKDFDSFIKTAAWMRVHLNEGMFVYAFTLAVRHREDCKSLITPPPYEIYPYYFVRADVIQKAYMLKMKNGLLDPNLCEFYGIRKTDKDEYVIDENVFDTRTALNVEDGVRYFTEDIDLNTYYYYFHVDNPFWMKDGVHKTSSRKWELTTYVYQQILARYNLERLSNKIPEVQPLYLYKPIKTGYWPWMILNNGVVLPPRPNNYLVVRDDNTDIVNMVETYLNIITEAVLKGYIAIKGVRYDLTKPEDIELLGRIIYHGNVDENTNLSEIDASRYLLVLMKSAIGLNTLTSDKYFAVPTVLDQYQTALRDPIFYQIQKRLIDIVYLFKRRLPSYTKEEVGFPGVKIDNVVTDKLQTYFNDFFVDITNAVTLTQEELSKTKSNAKYLARKRRLSHDPFKVSLEVLSDKAVDSVVRLFLGPKEDVLGRPIDINKNRLNFVEIDSFKYKLKTGKNVISRNSAEMNNIVKDRIMTRELLKKLETETDIKNVIARDFKNFQTGFPARLLLPKGKVGGMNMILYVIITPLRPVDNIDSSNTDPNNKILETDFRSTALLDKMPLGFPLDRNIEVTNFYTPNMKFVDIVIFHKKSACDMKTRWEQYVLRNYNLDQRFDQY